MRSQTGACVILTLSALSSFCKCDNATDADVYTADEVAHKSPSGILHLRGFRTEVHYAINRDGYHLHLVRVINPLHAPGRDLKRPVLFNHGLLESSTIWLVNSRDVRPAARGASCHKGSIDPEVARNGTEYRNLALMLALNGYDVWLMSMRGTDYSLYHEHLDRSAPKFWDYSLDQFAQDDVPTAIDYIRSLTKAPKVGYIGHSQATFSIFGLLATRPHYADFLEPVVAVAPVAYFHRIASKSRKLFLALVDTELNGPVPQSAKNLRHKLDKLCKLETGLGLKICRLLEELIGGLGKEVPAGYYSHLPFFTSLKVVRHFGQLIRDKRFGMYDHGPGENLARYGREAAPLYEVARIRSRRLVLVWSRTDALSVVKDVEQFISELRVPLHKSLFIDSDLNHFDLITAKDSAHLVNAPLLEIFEQFERLAGNCREWPRALDGLSWRSHEAVGGK